MFSETYHSGFTTLAGVNKPGDLKHLLKDSSLNTARIIIKPNWVGTEQGLFTDSETLRMVIEALDCEVTLTESYQIHRIPREVACNVKFRLEGNDQTLRWLQKEGWFWVEKNPNWDWFKEKGLWSEIRKLDKSFRDENGFTDLLNDYGVHYVNVTEEVWQGRTAPANEVKNLVEDKFGPVYEERMYDFVPEKLYRLREESIFISLAKVKNYETFTVKNLFGLIPDPLRAWWHGPKNQRFDRSVAGITKIYASVFRLFGVCEALSTTAVRDSGGEFGEGDFRYRLVDAPGIVVLGRNLAELDALTCASFNMKLKELSYLKDLEDVLGTYESSQIQDLKTRIGVWST